MLQTKFEPEDMLALIERHKITHMHIVPAMFVRLLRLPDPVRERYDVASLRHVVHGAAPCAPKIKSAMLAWWGSVIHEYYGSTETGLLTLLDPQEAVRKPGSVGRALPDVVLEIHDADGRSTPAGLRGDVYAGSSAARAFTYTGQDQDRSEATRGALVTVGDVGWLDGDGYLFLCGRKSEMIRSGTSAVHPAEIEAVLLDVPGVKDCAVFGIPHVVLGEAVCAHIEPMPGLRLTADSIRADLASRLDETQRPHTVEIVLRLPREDSGKIFKQKLRARYLPR